MGTSPSDVIVVMPRASDTMGTNAACEFSEAKTMRPICLAVLAVDSDWLQAFLPMKAHDVTAHGALGTPHLFDFGRRHVVVPELW